MSKLKYVVVKHTTVDEVCPDKDSAMRAAAKKASQYPGIKYFVEQRLGYFVSEAVQWVEYSKEGVGVE